MTSSIFSSAYIAHKFKTLCLKLNRFFTYSPIFGKIKSNDLKLIASIRRRKLSYCGFPKMENLVLAAKHVNDCRIEGIFLEAGVALGGSAILLSSLKNNRSLYLYDVFGLIPPPNNKDSIDSLRRYEEIVSGNSSGLGGDLYYGYQDNLMNKVSQNLASFSFDPSVNDIHLIKGDFVNTLFPSQSIALAHVDCDWYESVITCIERLVPFITNGGLIVFDDYNSYDGCRRAVDTYLLTRSDFEVFHLDRSIVLKKLSSNSLL